LLSFLTDIDEMSAGAVASEHPNNPRLLKEQRGQRQPKKITVENFHNIKMMKDEDEEKGILPKSSREQTPMDDSAIPSPKNELTSEISFFSGNPFIEVTKGILHLYKKK
jgi:BRCA1-associated protein